MCLACIGVFVPFSAYKAQLLSQSVRPLGPARLPGLLGRPFYIHDKSETRETPTNGLLGTQAAQNPIFQMRCVQWPARASPGRLLDPQVFLSGVFECLSCLVLRWRHTSSLGGLL